VSGLRRAARFTLTALALALVWFALTGPSGSADLSPRIFLRIPVEALALGVLALLLPARARTVAALVLGGLLGVITMLRLLDIGFYAALGRPFDPVADWGYFGSATGLLGDSIGRRAAAVVVVVVAGSALTILATTPLAVRRLSRLVSRHRRASARALTVLAAAWFGCLALGLQLLPGTPLASHSALGLAVDQVRHAQASLRDAQTFGKAVTTDTLSRTPPRQLLTGLRGKDVIVVFVESYGRVAVQDSSMAPGVDAVLDAGTQQLSAAGFGARSGFLTSPTFGGVSWLAHSTLQSGLWVNNQLRYDTLLAGRRETLSEAFKRAGWRTVADVPSNEQNWSQGSRFYRYDTVYDARNVGYAGPKFSYASMPDQYVLSAFRRAELAAPGHRPVMAEIDLVSSHTPWTPVPRLVNWDSVGDGTVFGGMSGPDQTGALLSRSAAEVRAAYGQSIQYTMRTLISFVRNFHDDNLVLVVLGDHQPATVVSGRTPGRDVPISIIAHDPAVLACIASWGWQDGLRPGPDAPVWPMSDFRDRFLAAYGPDPAHSAPKAESPR
jgi:hypothetical protein